MGRQRRQSSEVDRAIFGATQCRHVGRTSGDPRHDKLIFRPRCRALSCRSHFICSMKICVRICGQLLTINGIRLPGKTQARTNTRVDAQENLTDCSIGSSRHNTRPLQLQTLSHLRCDTLHPGPTIDVSRSFCFSILPFALMNNDLRPSTMFHPSNFELFHHGLRGFDGMRMIRDPHYPTSRWWLFGRFQISIDGLWYHCG